MAAPELNTSFTDDTLIVELDETHVIASAAVN